MPASFAGNTLRQLGYGARARSGSLRAGQGGESAAEALALD